MDGRWTRSTSLRATQGVGGLRGKVDSSLIFISDLKVEISDVGGRHT